MSREREELVEIIVEQENEQNCSHDVFALGMCCKNCLADAVMAWYNKRIEEFKTSVEMHKYIEACVDAAVEERIEPLRKVLNDKRQMGGRGHSEWVCEMQEAVKRTVEEQ